jgi:hypothetical protein
MRAVARSASSPPLVIVRVRTATQALLPFPTTSKRSSERNALHSPYDPFCTRRAVVSDAQRSRAAAITAASDTRSRAQLRPSPPQAIVQAYTAYGPFARDEQSRVTREFARSSGHLGREERAKFRCSGGHYCRE